MPGQHGAGAFSSQHRHDSVRPAPSASSSCTKQQPQEGVRMLTGRLLLAACGAPMRERRRGADGGAALCSWNTKRLKPSTSSTPTAMAPW